MNEPVVKIRKGNLPPGPGPGRPKGQPNKLTMQLKDMILGALDKAGGIDYLTRLAESNPTAFTGLIGRVLPTTLVGDPNAPLGMKLTVEFEKASDAGSQG